MATNPPPRPTTTTAVDDDDDEAAVVIAGGLEVIDNGNDAPVPTPSQTNPTSSSSLEIIGEDNITAPLPVEFITDDDDNTNTDTSDEAHSKDPTRRKSDVETVILLPPTPSSSMMTPQDDEKALDAKEKKLMLDGNGTPYFETVGRGSEVRQGIDSNILLSTSERIEGDSSTAFDPSTTVDEESLMRTVVVAGQDGVLLADQYPILEATMVDDVVYDAIPIADLSFRKRQLKCAFAGLVLLVAAATGLTVAVMTSNTNRKNESSIYKEPAIELAEDGLLADWVKCTDSLQCSNGCCSGTFSQGKYRCTPLDGGFLPGTCIGEGERQEESRGDWVDCNSSLQCTNGCCSSNYSEGFFKCTPLIGGYLGDPDICISHLEESKEWENCTTSDECSDGCCSSTYSEGVLKCTPLVGGYRNDTCVGKSVKGEESLGDWVECSSSLQCTNGCCSNTYSEGFWKCTPLIGGYLGDPDICISHLEESKEWENCTTSDECSSECCSGTYSDGVLKCTPLYGGYRNDTCVGISVKEEESIGDWVECSSSLQCTNGCCSNAYSEGFWKCTPLIGGYLGDPEICMSHAEESKEWDNCTTSDECSTGCCSSTYSEGVLKCTPLYGGYRNDTCVGISVKDEESIGDWVECSSSLQCTNGCCSNAYSEGFWKCTPLIGGYLGDPEICMSHAEESKGWTNCTTSVECSSGCCSSTYSEGVLKCTPLYGGYRNDTCVGEE